MRLRKICFVGFLLIFFLFVAGELETAFQPQPGRLPEKALTKEAQPVRLASALPQPRPWSSISEVRQEQMRPKTPLEVAENYLLSHREELRIQSHHEFRPVLVNSPVGTTVKYSVFQDNIPIMGMEIKVQIGADLSVSSVENHYIPAARVEISQAGVLTAEEVVERVGGQYASSPDTLSSVSSVLYMDSNSEAPELAYVLRVHDKSRNSAPAQVVFRASDGQLLSKNVARQEF